MELFTDKMGDTVVIREAGTPTIELRGALGVGSARMLLDATEELIARGHTDIHIDCSSVEAVDRAAAPALSDVCSLARSTGGRYRLSGIEDLLDALDVPERPSTAERRSSWFCVPARPENSAYIRRRVGLLAQTMPFSDQQLEDIALAVGEAASNAIRHGSPDGERSRVSVACCREDSRLVVSIGDQGPGFDPEARLCRNPQEPVEGGRGLLLMRLLMDDVTFCFDGGATVRMTKKIQAD